MVYTKKIQMCCTLNSKPPSSITITLNGKLVECFEKRNIYSILATFKGQIPTDGVAVGINNEIVPKSKWADVTVKEGDHVEVLTVAAGG